MRQVRLAAEYVGTALVTGVRPRGPSPQARCARDRDWVVAVDAMLTTRAHVHLPYVVGQELVTATPDLGLVVTSGPDGTELHGAGAQVHLGVDDADSATLVAHDQLLLTAPAGDGTHRAHLVDLRRREVVDVAELDCDRASATAIPHPHDGTVLVDLQEGEGSRLYAVVAGPGRLEVRELLQDTVPAGFSADGQRLLVLPHPAHDVDVWLAAWPGGDPLVTLTPTELRWSWDAFLPQGCLLDDRTTLLLTKAHGVVVADGHLGAAHALELMPGDVTALLGLWPGLFATEHVRDGVPVTRVYQLSPPV